MEDSCITCPHVDVSLEVDSMSVDIVGVNHFNETCIRISLDL